jgi:uracil-DNA glycosylase
MTRSHLEPLAALVEELRHPPGPTERFVPGFDPRSGGVGARVLVLMESPGPATIAQGAAAISSEDNPGPTAAAFRAARLESGLAREDYLRWNVIPWALPRKPTVDDLEEARPALGHLLTALPELRAVVAFGTPALTGIMRYFTLDAGARVVPVLAAPHPSPANATRSGEKHLRAVTALRHAARL